MKAADRLATLFDWPARHSVQVVLPLMFVVAALAHAAGLTAFRLSPPTVPPAHRPAATVYTLLPVTGGSRAMEASLAADDPSLFSPSSSEERGIWKLPPSDYRPALPEMMPALKPLTLEEHTRTVPQALAPAPVPTAPTPSPSHAVPPAPPSTVVKFSSDLAARQPEGLATPSFSAPEKQDLLPATFLLATDPEGRVLHVFPLETSGYESLDLEAARCLGRLRFSPAPKTTWGTATFLWGADVRRLRVE